MLHYLPGCDVRKNHPEAIFKLENYMKNKDAIIEQCCRVKESFLDGGDVIVNNCTLCNLILKETHPNNECLSLYEYVLTDSNFPWSDHQGETIIIQDCWRAREDRALQDAIRQCLLKMNFNIIEMDENYDKSKFCGVWLNNQPAQICIDVAPNTFSKIINDHLELLSPEAQKAKMIKWNEQYSNDNILVYCNGCEKGIKLGGRDVIHMVELLAEGIDKQ